MSVGNKLIDKLIPIPNPKPIPDPFTIQPPFMINAPNPITEPFTLPSTDAVDFTFEDINMIGWTVVDEPPQLLGEGTSSRWIVTDGPISGKALAQTSNIWGDKNDVVPLGTFVIYDLREWTDFVMEFDCFAADNDGLGIVWGWKSRLNHYRFLTMIDPANPTGAPPDKRAPFSVIEKRTGDNSPYYQTLSSKREASYHQYTVTHLKLEVANKTFKVYRDGRLSLQASDGAYQGGKVGFTLYAHAGIYFDNVKIDALIPSTLTPEQRVTGVWR